jgi:hypothetical protein
MENGGLECERRRRLRLTRLLISRSREKEGHKLLAEGTRVCERMVDNNENDGGGSSDRGGEVALFGGGPHVPGPRPPRLVALLRGGFRS